MRGLVPDDATKAKAIALIKDTVGVTHVIDQLSVLPSSAALEPAQSAVRQNGDTQAD